MNELFFPLIGAMVVFLIAVPLFTLAALAMLALLPAAKDELVAHVSPLRFALIVGPTLGPVIWLVSAAVHQSEEGVPLAACVLDHLGGDVCRDVVMFGLILLSVVGLGAIRRMRGHRAPPRASRDHGAEAAALRVQRACEASPTLVAWASRIRVVSRGLAPACTRGMLRPRIQIEAELVERLNEEELAATLLHEVEHALARDPLRFFVAQVALSVNPFGALLSSELSRYHFAREALCDRRAVQRGAEPLALARSIVSVAAPGPAPMLTAALGGHGIGGVRVRVQLLLGYAAQRPGPAERNTRIGVATTLVTALAALPHFTGTAPLDVLHHSVERAVLILGLG